MEVTLLRTKLINVAEIYVGVTEATGKNDGRQVLQFQKSVGLKSGAGWCAAFVAFCHKVLNIVCPNTGYCPNWFTDNVIYRQNSLHKKGFDPRPGQVIGEISGARIGHVSFLVKKIDKDHYLKIGGNETNGVRKSIIHIRDIWAVSDYVGVKELIK